ncbi:MAG: sulfotransferase [Halioglobus sp.]|nr:sulfotransferase [Halioglobus sp.]
MTNPLRMRQRQAAYITLTNRVGRLLENTGFQWPDLHVDRLIATAVRRTGLEDFGDDSFREGLARLTRELQRRGKLSQLGRVAAYFNLLENLCVRLRIINYRTRHPEIADQQIQQPLIITGLPRTGTTILFELIAQDPDVRSPASWEVAKPIPPARSESYDTDRRIKSVDRFMGMAERLSPGFKAIHAIGARLPQECVYIFASQFISEQFGYMFHVPDYRDWALRQNMTSTYRWHAHFLQHMQSRFRAERWVLKTPSHLAHLDSLLAQYPDAAVVWTHRRPLHAMASFSSLTSRLQSAFSDAVDRAVVAAHEFDHAARVLTSGMVQRTSLEPRQFFDVSFEAICADPINVIRTLYAHFGFAFSQEAETRMRDYLRRHPRNLYGKHRYTAAEFGLDATREEALFSPYLSQYAAFL